MAFTYDLDTDAGKVRLLISDIGGTGGSGAEFIFDDDEIDTFLSMESGIVYRASAVALRTIAANEAFVSKRIQFLELKTDGPAVAKALRELAAEFDKQADEGASEIFDLIAIGDTDFSRRDLRGIE